MQTWCVIASGPSLNDADVDYIRQAREDGRLAGVVAVSNVGIDKAPWADILVSYDAAWWRAYPEAFEFKGEKYCSQKLQEVDQWKCPYFSGCNSGLMGMYIALERGADKIIMLGFDMHGSHYFGPHIRSNGTLHLKNSSEKIFNRHKAQFRQWRGCPVVNCTPGSALDFFPMAELRGTI